MKNPLALRFQKCVYEKLSICYLIQTCRIFLQYLILINPPSSESYLLLTYLCNYWCIYHLSYIYFREISRMKIKIHPWRKTSTNFWKISSRLTLYFLSPVSLLFANSYWLYFNEKYKNFDHLTSHLFSLYDFTPFFFHMRCWSWGSWGAPYPLFSLSIANPEWSIENRMTLRSNMAKASNIKENYHLLLKTKLNGFFKNSFFSKISGLQKKLWKSQLCNWLPTETALKKDLWIYS